MNASRILLAFALTAIATTQFARAGQGSPSNLDNWLEYSRCMRANGYAKFPDPDSRGYMRLNVDPRDKSQFDAAQVACRDKFPPGTRNSDRAMTPERMQGLLAYAKCMRGNGIKDFPDPTAQGVFEIGATVPDVLSPVMGKAMESCSASQPALGISIRKAKP